MGVIVAAGREASKRAGIARHTFPVDRLCPFLTRCGIGIGGDVSAERRLFTSVSCMNNFSKPAASPSDPACPEVYRHCEASRAGRQAGMDGPQIHVHHTDPAPDGLPTSTKRSVECGVWRLHRDWRAQQRIVLAFRFVQRQCRSDLQACIILSSCVSKVPVRAGRQKGRQTSMIWFPGPHTSYLSRT
jgi:hypothetical protein